MTRPALRARILLLLSIAVLLRRVADSHGRANVHGASTQWSKREDTSPFQAGLSRPQGGDSIPPPERGRSTAFASLRSKCCPVGGRRLGRAFGDHGGLELTPP